MEKIKIDGAESLYEIESIKQHDSSTVCITFAQYVDRVIYVEKISPPDGEDTEDTGLIDDEDPATTIIPALSTFDSSLSDGKWSEEWDAEDETSEEEEQIELVEKIITVEQELPTEYGDITIYTSGGVYAGVLTGYDTIYRDEGLTVYLSNDGSVYTPPEDIEGLPEEPYIYTAEELKPSKLLAVNAACTAAIAAGCDVTLSDETVEHFSLSETDQINLSAAVTAIQAGSVAYPYHADGELCKMYSADDIMLIGAAATEHKLYHTTYCNHLRAWINRAETIEELDAIYYGAALPDDLDDNMNAILTAVSEGA